MITHETDGYGVGWELAEAVFAADGPVTIGPMTVDFAGASVAERKAWLFALERAVHWVAFKNPVMLGVRDALDASRPDGEPRPGEPGSEEDGRGETGQAHGSDL